MEAWRSGSGRLVKPDQVWRKARALQIANITIISSETKLPMSAI